MTFSRELDDLSRGHLYDVIHELREEIVCLKTDLIKYKFVSKSYEKYFQFFIEVNETIASNEEVLHLIKDIKLFNSLTEKKCSVTLKRVTDNCLNESDVQSVEQNLSENQEKIELKSIERQIQNNERDDTSEEIPEQKCFVALKRLSDNYLNESRVQSVEHSKQVFSEEDDHKVIRKRGRPPKHESNRETQTLDNHNNKTTNSSDNLRTDDSNKDIMEEMNRTISGEDEHKVSRSRGRPRKYWPNSCLLINHKTKANRPRGRPPKEVPNNETQTFENNNNKIINSSDNQRTKHSNKDLVEQWNRINSGWEGNRVSRKRGRPRKYWPNSCTEIQKTLESIQTERQKQNKERDDNSEETPKRKTITIEIEDNEEEEDNCVISESVIEKKPIIEELVNISINLTNNSEFNVNSETNNSDNEFNSRTGHQMNETLNQTIVKTETQSEDNSEEISTEFSIESQTRIEVIRECKRELQEEEYIECNDITENNSYLVQVIDGQNEEFRFLTENNFKTIEQLITPTPSRGSNFSLHIINKTNSGEDPTKAIRRRGRPRKYRPNISQSNEDIFVCDICSVTLKTKDSLKMHKKNTHSGKYLCGINGCQQRTDSKWELIRHKQKTHPSERPYKCVVSGCDYRFKTKNSLSAHVINLHKILGQSSDEPEIKQYDCLLQFCQGSFSSRMNLREHMESYHKLSPNLVNIHFKKFDKSRALKETQTPDNNHKITNPSNNLRNNDSKEIAEQLNRTNSEEEDHKVSRKRGRPPKLWPNSSLLIKNKTKSGEYSTKSIRKRGRPPKYSPNSSLYMKYKTISGGDDHKVFRKRGRPRKHSSNSCLLIDLEPNGGEDQTKAISPRGEP